MTRHKIFYLNRVINKSHLHTYTQIYLHKKHINTVSLSTLYRTGQKNNIGMHIEKMRRFTSAFFLCKMIFPLDAYCEERDMFEGNGNKNSEQFFELWTKELGKELTGFWNDFVG